MKKDTKDRDLTTIIEDAFEAGFLSLLGPCAFRSPDVHVVETEGRNAASSAPAVSLPGRTLP